MTGISTQRLIELFLCCDEGVIVLRFGDDVSVFAENDLRGAIDLLQKAIDLSEASAVRKLMQ